MLKKSSLPYCIRIGVRSARGERLDLASDLTVDQPPARYLEEPIQDYELALAARSRGLLYGRSAWNDGRETWLIDFPLLVVVINRLRTQQARRFQATALGMERYRDVTTICGNVSFGDTLGPPEQVDAGCATLLQMITFAAC